MPSLALATFLIALTYAGLVVALTLALLRPPLPRAARVRHDWPAIDVVVPARDEAEALPEALASLRAQDYPGRFLIWVVDDRSHDATAALVRQAAERDARVRLVQVKEPSRRLAPKVNAVAHGIAAGTAAWIVTTDADCVHPRGWLRALLRAAGERDVMVSGYVETARFGTARGLFARIEALDWSALMITNRALMRLGACVASSANNQAYRRAAFEAIGGFGVAGRAPSGDEDLLVQRFATLPSARMAFTDAPDARVLTASTGSWLGFLRQRRRWVSRYHHPQHYRPAFLAGIGLLGVHSVSLSLTTLSASVWPASLPWLVASWVVVLAAVIAGMRVGLGRLGRRDLMGWPLWVWALLHPFVITTAVLWSLVRPGSWRAGAERYRRRWWRAWWRVQWRRAWRRRSSGDAP